MTDMDRYDYNVLAHLLRHRAAQLFHDIEDYEFYAYEAAHVLAEKGITDIIGRPNDGVVEQVIRDCTSFPDDSDWSDDEGNYVEWSEGDIVDGPAGLGIVLPAGEVWHLSDEKALSLMRGLSTMICYRLTQPWSADDDSTILSRGVRPVLREA